jgi:hypothetical protein
LPPNETARRTVRRVLSKKSASNHGQSIACAFACVCGVCNV